MAYQDLILSHGPVAYWPLDDAPGTGTSDVSGNGLNLAWIGGYNPNWEGLIKGGTTGRYLDGTDDYGIMQNNPPLLQIIGDQTFEAWIQPDDMVSTRRGVMSKAYGGEGNITINNEGFTPAPKTISYYYGITGGNTGSSTAEYQAHTTPAGSILQGRIYHIVHVRDLTAMELRWYIDGELISVIPASFESAVAGSEPFMLGKSHVSSLKGLIDQVAVYDRALTTEEVESHFLAGFPPIEPLVVAPDHVASRWQVDLLGGDFSAPLIDTGEDAINLLTYGAVGLPDGTDLKGRVALIGSDASQSEWSDPVFFSTLTVDVQAPPGRVARIPRPSLQNQTRLSHMAPPRLDNLQDAERHMQDLAHRLNRLIDDYNKRQ